MAIRSGLGKIGLMARKKRQVFAAQRQRSQGAAFGKAMNTQPQGPPTSPISQAATTDPRAGGIQNSIINPVETAGMTTIGGGNEQARQDGQQMMMDQQQAGMQQNRLQRAGNLLTGKKKRKKKPLLGSGLGEQALA